MTLYTVTWSLPLDADEPEDAVMQALGIQRDAASVATWFRVEADDGTDAMIDAQDLIDAGYDEGG